MAKPVVMVVEDDANDQDLIRAVFRSAELPAELKIVSDGREALKVLHGTPGARSQRSAAPPILVLLDLKMPHLNGIDTLRIIRKDPGTSNLPVVVFSSSNQEQDVLASYEAGANSFITKPIEFETFAHVLARVVEYWLTMNEPPPAVPRIPAVTA